MSGWDGFWIGAFISFTMSAIADEWFKLKIKELELKYGKERVSPKKKSFWKFWKK